MKSVIIYGDAETGKLGYRVHDGQKIVQRELSAHTEIRKLHSHPRRTIGRSIVMASLGI